MRTLYFFWYQLNWLEFVTYVIFPSSIVLIIFVYILFNLKLFRASANLSNRDELDILNFLIDDEFFGKTNKNDK